MIADRIAHHVPRVLPAAREIAIVGSLFLLYNWVRVVIRDQENVAQAHAGQVHRFEAAIGLPSEAWLQGFVANVPHFFEYANRYYTSVHFPLTLFFLVWGFTMRPRAEYVWARRLLIVQTFLALVIHVAYPLAPPRMFPQWGFMDPGALWGPSPYQGASGAVANQFAAMPSLHIGWAVLIAVVVTRTGPRWVAGLAWLHASRDRLRRRDHGEPLVDGRHRRGGPARCRPGALPRPGRKECAHVTSYPGRTHVSQSAVDHPELLAPSVAAALASWADGNQIAVVEIDPEHADTAAMVAAYDVPLDAGANCVVVAGRRDGEERVAACLVRADTRADVNNLVKRTLDVRKCSFLSMDRAVEESGMEYGGITPVGLPTPWRVLVDSRCLDIDVAIIGSGVRRSKLLVPGRLLGRLPGADVLDGLAH